MPSSRSKGFRSMGINLRPHTMSGQEEELLHAAEVGDLLTVTELLSDNTDLNVNVTNLMGRTPLRLAAANEHLEVVEVLLDRTDYQHVYEALLFAIVSNHEDICITILNYHLYPAIRQQCQQLPATQAQHSDTSTSQFPPEITPLILASQYNRFETVMMLVQMGESIPHPHAFDCKCEECSSTMEFDELRFARSRLNRYLGLASEAYISLSSSDPVLTAFKLASELRKVARVEKHYRKEYRDLTVRLSDYTVSLLNNVRGVDELDVILNANEGTSVDLACYGRLPRLKLAVHYKEKKFVAHPACQMKLTSIMYGHLSHLSHYHWATRMVIILAIMLVYPILAAIYWFAPNSKVGRLLKVPMIRFAAQTTYYLIFLLLIVTYSLTEKGIQMNQVRLSEISTFFELTKPYPDLHSYIQEVVVRPYEVNKFLLCVVVYLFCMVWQGCRQIYREGFQGYKDSVFNWMDFFLIQLYLSSFALRYLVMIKVHLALEYFEKAEAWEQLNGRNASALSSMYWLSSDRFLWDPADPQSVSEGLFAVANVFSFSRLSFLLAIDDSLGPLQLSLRLMIKDVLKFTVIFLLFVVAFVVGLHNLYWYYDPEVLRFVSVGGDRNNRVDFPVLDAFGSISDSVKTVFWALFGMSDSNVVDLGSYPNEFTQTVGFLLYAMYNWVMVIVLLNMLIAMMSRSFELVTGDQDVEWKFSLTCLFMEYIKDSSYLPPPFNVIPTPKAMMRFCCQVLRRKKSITEEVELQQSVNHGSDTYHMRKISLFHSKTDEGTTGDAFSYKSVIKKVLNRYIERTVLQSSVVGNEEIKQDLSSFRFEILGRLKTSDNGGERLEDSLKDVKERQHRMERHLDTMSGELRQLISLTSAFLQHESQRRRHSQGSEGKETECKDREVIEERITRDSEDRGREGKDSEGREGKDSEGRGREGKDSEGREGKDSEGRGREGKDSEGRGREGKDSEGSDREGKDRDGRGREGKDSEGREGKDSEGRGREGKDSEGREGKDSEGRGREGKDSEGRGREGKDSEGSDREGKDRDGRGREGKDREGRGREDKDSEGRGREGKDRKGKDKEQNDKEGKDDRAIKKDTEVKDRDEVKENESMKNREVNEGKDRQVKKGRWGRRNKEKKKNSEWEEDRDVRNNRVVKKGREGSEDWDVIEDREVKNNKGVRQDREGKEGIEEWEVSEGREVKNNKGVRKDMDGTEGIEEKVREVKDMQTVTIYEDSTMTDKTECSLV